MTPEQEQTLLTGVGVIKEKVVNIEIDIKEIKTIGCPKGIINNGRIKLNKQSIEFMRWLLGGLVLSILGIAFFIIRQKLVGG